MLQWLYGFFATTIALLIYMKEGGNLLSLLLFLMTASRTPSLWIHPPEPSLLLSKYRFDLATLWRPHIFLWLPHPSGLMAIFMKELRSNLEFVYFQVNCDPPSYLLHLLNFLLCLLFIYRNSSNSSRNGAIE